jgi:hypothetical protein
MVWLLTALVFLVAVGALALGVMFTGRRLQGSCGGTSGAACLCKPGSDPRDCPKKTASAQVEGEPKSERGLNVLNNER